jgi:solute carrier family 35 protein
MKIKKVGSALFYGIASLMITFANKIVLTSYKFQSYQALALGQVSNIKFFFNLWCTFSSLSFFFSKCIITILVLQFAKRTGLIKMSKFDFKTAWKLAPLSLFYFGNLVFGLGGTKSLKY